MTWSNTHSAMAVAAAITAGLIFFAPEDSVVVVSAPTKSRPVVAYQQTDAASAPVKDEGELLASARSRNALQENAAAKLFSKGTWFVPPPPPKPVPVLPPPPPPPPSAPPLPYTYLGKYSEGELQLVVLTKGNRVVTASKGDVLENTYRIERIEANTVIFTYLPLNSSQTLNTGSN